MMRTIGTTCAIIVAVVSLLSVAAPGNATAAPPMFGEFCAGGQASGQCEIPRGIGVAPFGAPAPNQIYIADQNNKRVNEFDAWGQFIKSWGWGVDTGAAKLEICTELSSCQNPAIPAGSGTGGGAGQLGGGPQGVAVDSAGAIYVVDQTNRRVQKFSPSAQFLLLFGGDVVSSGPGNTGANEQQTMTVKATGGKFSLSATTGTGTGHPILGSNVVEIAPTLGTFNVGDAVTGSGIPANTTVTAVGIGSLTLSNNATQTNITELTAKENTGGTGTGNLTSGSAMVSGIVARTGEFSVGERISGTGIPVGTTIESTALGEGKLTLSAPASANGTAIVLTGTDIPFNATALELRVALEALPGIAAGDLTVTGGPGDATGTAPYVVTFAGGLLAHNDLDPMTSTTTNLEGTKTATITAVNGGGPEICKAASGDICKKGIDGTASGQFGGWAGGNYLAVGPSDQIYVGDKGRIQRFNTAGQYQSEISSGLSGKTVRGVAVDPAGNVYAAISGEDNVLKWTSAGAPLAGINVLAPLALAADSAASGENIYVISGSSGSLVRKFTSAGVEVESWGQEEPPSPAFGEATGIAVGTACFGAQPGIYVGNNNPRFVRAYGPPPVDTVTCPPPNKAPSIVSQFATDVDVSSATLRATINPRYWDDATYYVQYGTASCVEGGWSSACVEEVPAPPGVGLGVGSVEEDVLTAPTVLTGLQAGTIYRYRFAAVSGGGGPVFGVGGEVGVDGSDGTFSTFTVPGSPPVCSNGSVRTGFSAGLPDCRAYEMVSPVDKGNAEVAVPGPAGGLTDLSVQPQLAATEGNAITYTSFTAFGNPKSAPAASQYLSRRSETGWSTENITPFDFEGYTRDPLVGFTADLSRAIVNVTNPALVPGAPEGVQNLYRRDNDDGSLELLTTNVPVLTVEKSAYEAVFSGASDGLETVAFGAEGKLTTDAPIATGAAKNLYLWSEDGGLQLLSVFPNGSPAPANAFNGIGGQAIAFGPSGQPQRNAISDDGSRVFWTYGGVYEGETKALFSRLNGSTTIQIDKPNQGVPGNGGGAQYWLASTDGSRAFFTDVNNLTADANATSGSPDLYMYDFDLPAGERLIDISANVGEAAAVQGVLGASDDGSYVYFVAQGKLTGEAENVNGEKAQPGQQNLYGWHQGDGLRFIGTLGSPGSEDAANRESRPNLQTSRVSPSGRFVAFHSINRLTGYDNTDIGTGDPDSEVFLYDFQNDRLVCASCNPGGGRPAGSASLPTWGTPHQQPRYLSDSGRVFFESFDALSLSDVNEKRDVYQFELSGTGGCSPSGAGFVPISGGCVALVSTGTSSDESYFVDASQNGNDVFITTRQRLRPKEDLDERYDVYDARVGGGFDEPQPPLACEGEGCRGAVTGPGPAALAGTGNFSGPGDPAPKRCKKGFTRKDGKCVRVKSKSGKKGKKSRGKARHSRKTGRAGR